MHALNNKWAYSKCNAQGYSQGLLFCRIYGPLRLRI